MLQNRGFTLIEIVIYLALFSLVLAGFILVTYNLVQGSAQVQSKAVLNEEMAFLLHKIDWALTGAESSQVTVVSPSVLQITKPSLLLIFTFDSGAKTLSLQRGLLPIVLLSSASVAVTNLTFTELSPVGGRKGIKTEITLTNLGESQTDSSTKYLRL